MAAVPCTIVFYRSHVDSQGAVNRNVICYTHAVLRNCLNHEIGFFWTRFTNSSECLFSFGFLRHSTLIFQDKLPEALNDTCPSHSQSWLLDLWLFYNYLLTYNIFPWKWQYYWSLSICVWLHKSKLPSSLWVFENFMVFLSLPGPGVVRWAGQTVMDGTAEVHGNGPSWSHHARFCSSYYRTGGKDRPSHGWP